MTNEYRYRTMTQKVEKSRVNARIALEAYRATGGQDEDNETCIGDLIADLLHLAEDVGVLPSDVGRFVAGAVNHYEYESDPDNAEDSV